MERPPAHYRAYWKLQDNEKDLEELSTRILLYYIQSNYDTNLERLEHFQNAAKWVGFNCEIMKHNGEEGFNLPDDELPIFEEMRENIRNIRRGNFESEVVQISSILSSYKKKTPRWFWQKWPKVQEKEKKSFKFL